MTKKIKNREHASSTPLSESAIAPVSLDELETFRQKWQQEVLEKREAQSSLSSSTISVGNSDSKANSMHASTHSRDSPHLHRMQPTNLSPKLVGIPPPFLLPTDELKRLNLGESEGPLSVPVAESSPTVPVRESSIFGRVTGKQFESWKLYRKATVCERQGNLSNALTHYRASLKENPQAEQEYRKLLSNPQDSVAQLFFQQVSAEEKRELVNSNAGDLVDAEAFMTYYELEDTPKDGGTAYLHFTKGGVVAVEEGERSRINPANPDKPCPIDSLPDDILLVIAQACMTVDLYAISRLALVSRRFYQINHNQSLWKRYAEITWRQRANSRADALWLECETQYEFDWRRLCILKPRVRRDGFYISRVNYVRVGQDEGINSQPVHMVTYYRYLYFLTQNTCVSLTSTLEPLHAVKALGGFATWRVNGLESFNLTPQEEEKEFRRYLLEQVLQGSSRERLKGLMYGRYSITDGKNTVVVEQRDPHRVGTVFRLSLCLKSSKVGQCNLLTWNQYVSYPAELATSDYQPLSNTLTLPPEDSSKVTEYPLRHLKRFVFSRVKSWV